MTPEEKVKQRQDRNAKIVKLYIEGKSVKQCASTFRLGRMRVAQILKAAGVWRPYEKGDRTRHVGVVVSEGTREALQQKANEAGMSVSRFAAGVLDEATK